MANILLQAGAQSATFKVPTVPRGDGIFHGSLTITDWQKLPSGKLKSALTKSYSTIYQFGDDWAAAGGVVNVTLLSPEEWPYPESLVFGREFQFYLDGSGYPILYESENWEAYIRIQTAYSASE